MEKLLSESSDSDFLFPTSFSSATIGMATCQSHLEGCCKVYGEIKKLIFLLLSFDPVAIDFSLTLFSSLVFLFLCCDPSSHLLVRVDFSLPTAS